MLKSSVNSLKRSRVLKVDALAPDKKIIRLAARAVKAGRLVAFPTETVYGIAVNGSDAKALRRLVRIKGRPKGKPFTVHVAAISAITRMGCVITKDAKLLIDRFWPGPLTVILPSKRGRRKIGFRMPANPVALRLIRASGVPVAAPSANISGRRPPTDASDVLKYLGGKIDLVLDSGPTAVGVESTVVDLTVRPPKILREGAIKKEYLLKVIKL